MHLILVRHAESIWNQENKFTGLVDIDLSVNGIQSAKELSILFKNENINFDYVFTSNLKRAINTSSIICNNNTITYNSSDLNERDYGDLTGMNKTQAQEVLGIELFHKIRRGYETKPSKGESLEDVTKRVGLYYDNVISKLLINDNNILIVAHGNSLRALLVHLNIFDANTIENFEINSCVPIVVDINKKAISYINKYKLEGLQILDSRGYPTIQVSCINKITHRIIGKGSTPSGASCGSTEVVELRDNDMKYFMGKSVLKTINNLHIVNKNLQLNDHTIKNLKYIDKSLIGLDPSDFKDKLGGNLITAISFCMANAASNFENLELYEYISTIYNGSTINSDKNITPLVNIINGGKHGVTDNLKIQEFMIFANESYTINKKIQITTEVYHSLKKVLCEKYGPNAKSIGDEGGFCPPIETTYDAFNNILEAIKKINYIPGIDVFLALDCASSEFYNEDTKLYEIEKDLFLTSDELINYYGKLITDYPMLKSIEDGFHEKDYNAWAKFTELYGNKIMIVGDDLFTSNPKLIKKGIDNKLANTLLLKVNQIGTITEAIEGAQMMFDTNANVIVSHRSGETNHAYIIDIAKGIGAKYVKIGSPCRGERVEKFNRLLEIETINNIDN